MEEEAGHRWEGGVEATWEGVQVYADGTINVDALMEAQRRRKMK